MINNNYLNNHDDDDYTTINSDSSNDFIDTLHDHESVCYKICTVFQMEVDSLLFRIVESDICFHVIMHAL